MIAYREMVWGDNLVYLVWVGAVKKSQGGQSM